MLEKHNPVFDFVKSAKKTIIIIKKKTENPSSSNENTFFISLTNF